jgi:hypothetical protein
MGSEVWEAVDTLVLPYNLLLKDLFPLVASVIYQIFKSFSVLELLLRKKIPTIRIP